MNHEARGTDLHENRSVGEYGPALKHRKMHDTGRRKPDMSDREFYLKLSAGFLVAVLALAAIILFTGSNDHKLLKRFGATSTERTKK